MILQVQDQKAKCSSSLLMRKASKKVFRSHVPQEELELAAAIVLSTTNQAKKVIPSHDLQEAAGISITILLFRFLYKIATIVLSIFFLHLRKIFYANA